MSTDLESTRWIPRPLWDNPRIHLLDDVWLVTIAAILIATAVPWLASGFALDLGRATFGLLALGGVHFGFTLLASPLRWGGGWRERALTALDLLGVALIGFVWLHVGALQNPAFLAVFTLPVVGAIFLSRWHPYLVATASVAVVAGIALGQAPELRWYAGGLLGGEEWLAWVFGTHGAAPQAALAGGYAPLNYLVVVLEVFTVLLFACAVAAEYLGTIFERLNAHIVLARTEAAQGEKLWSDLIDRMPLPALLIDPFSFRIAAASDAARRYLQSGELPLEGRNFFDVVRFTYPDLIQDLIAGSADSAPRTMMRIQGRLHVVDVRVLSVAHRDRRLALLSINDASEVFYLRAALDAAEFATLVIDARGFVLAFNGLASGLFAGIAAGSDAAQLLALPEATGRWWEPGISGRRKLHAPIGPRLFQITTSVVPLAGEEERLYTVALLPVASSGAADVSRNNTTIMTQTLGRLR